MTVKRWKNLTSNLLNIDIPLLPRKLPLEMSKQASTLFYQEVFNCWYKYISMEPLTKSEVLDEYLCLNKHIKINSKHIYTNHTINQKYLTLKLKI